MKTFGLRIQRFSFSGHSAYILKYSFNNNLSFYICAMNAKWCISSLIVILVLLGLSQPHKRASNQQITLQFTDVEIASENARDEVLSNITQKLLFLGVEGIEIIEDDTSHVNIRYYSDIDANVVKEFLSNETSKPSGYKDELPFNFPNESLPENYSLVVSDLHQQAHNGLKINGNLVVAQKEVHGGFNNPVLLYANTPVVLRPDTMDQTAFKIHHNIAIAIDNTSRNIPEGRAGPCLLGKS